MGQPWPPNRERWRLISFALLPESCATRSPIRPAATFPRKRGKEGDSSPPQAGEGSLGRFGVRFRRNSVERVPHRRPPEARPVAAGLSGISPKRRPAECYRPLARRNDVGKRTQSGIQEIRTMLIISRC